MRTPTTPPVEHRQESIDQSKGLALSVHIQSEIAFGDDAQVWVIVTGGMEIITRASVGARCEWVMAMRGGSKALTQGHLQA